MIVSVFSFSYDKDVGATSTITIIHFYLRLQTFLSILAIKSSRYYVYKLPGKMENSTFSTQICLKNRFRFGISKN